MNKFTTYLILLLLVLASVACGAEVAEPVSVGAVSAETDTDAPQTTARTRLNQDHADAASLQTQLAVGSLSLEGTNFAIDEALAAEILPLWQAVQALGQSESTAPAELNAVVNQIQDSMSAEQITFISDMQLTDETIQAMITEGVIALGRGGPGGPPGEGDAAGGRGGQGGRGGGLPGGGGPGGGQGGPGGLAAGADLSEEELAERRAERFGDTGADDFLGNAMTGSVVRLLAVKTGTQQQPQQGNNIQPIILAVMAPALDMTEEALSAQLDDGANYAGLIAEAGADVTALRSELEAALADSPAAERGNLDDIINRILGEGGE